MQGYRARPALVLACSVAIALLAWACTTGAPAANDATGAPASNSVTPTGSLGSKPRFASGSCKSFGPTHGNTHRTIFIDAGHGGPDPGTSGRTPAGAPIEEKTATLAVALDLLPLLRAQGYRVVLSRTRDSSVVALVRSDLNPPYFSLSGEHRDLLARVACANAVHANLLLSIHFNGYSVPSVGGAETYYDAVRPFAAANERFATLVEQSIVAHLAQAGWQIPGRGIATDASDSAPALSPQAAAYHYLELLGPAMAGWLDHPSQMPGALSEPLFLTDPVEAGIAAGSAGQHAIAQGFDTAIQAYFATPPASSAPHP